MKRITEKVEFFVEECPICKKQIKGQSEKAVEYNLKLHLGTHQKT